MNGVEHNSDEVIEFLELAIKHIYDIKNSNINQLEYYNKIKLTTKYAMCYVGKFYKWGGSGPLFDCSGFTLELLKMNGFIGRGLDYTAQGQWDLFVKKRTNKVAEGCIVCYYINKTQRVGHIEYCINDKLSIGASGGGSKTLTEADAIRDNAFIKIRPIKRNRKIAGYFNPFLREE